MLKLELAYETNQQFITIAFAFFISFQLLCKSKNTELFKRRNVHGQVKSYNRYIVSLKLQRVNRRRENGQENKIQCKHYAFAIVSNDIACSRTNSN